jgi:hypothetical protein
MHLNAQSKGFLNVQEISPREVVTALREGVQGYREEFVKERRL